MVEFLGLFLQEALVVEAHSAALFKHGSTMTAPFRAEGMLRLEQRRIRQALPSVWPFNTVFSLETDPNSRLSFLHSLDEARSSSLATTGLY